MIEPGSIPLSPGPSWRQLPVRRHKSLRLFGLFLLSGLLACALRPLPEAPAERLDGGRPLIQLELLHRWHLSTLPGLENRIEWLADLADSLAPYGVIVGELPGLEFRQDSTAWVRTKPANAAPWMVATPLQAIGAQPDTLYTLLAVPGDSLALQIAGSKLFLENLTGHPCPTFSWPYHEHTRGMMEAARDAGYAAARCGAPGQYPWSPFLVGEPADPAWLDSWEELPLYEIPLNLFSLELQALDPAEIAAWLQEPERLPTWKANSTWIQLYTHSDNPEHTSQPILDGPHVAALLDALVADGDVWIAPVGEVAAFFRQSHVPHPGEPLVWVPDHLTGVPDGRELHWNGRSCAFSFSTDDGLIANFTTYLPVFLSRGLSFTAYLVPTSINAADQGNDHYLSSFMVMSMADWGIEIGSHSLNHPHMLPPEVGTIRLADPEGPELYFELVDFFNVKVLRLYEWRASAKQEDIP